MTRESHPRPRWLIPQWPAPATVRALCTLREGGVSDGAYASLNLATHVGDDPAAVLRNRTLVRESAQLPAEPTWLNQVHGIDVWEGTAAQTPPEADASVARRSNEIQNGVMLLTRARGSRCSAPTSGRQSPRASQTMKSAAIFCRNAWAGCSVGW